MGQTFDSILDTIGRTPCVRLNHLAPEGVQLYAKLEAFNPMGSVKDRLAREIIEQAERSGALRPGQTIIEATSGNTGLGLAMVAAQKGYPLVIVMAENFSIERRKMLRFLGAKVVITPASERGTGMVAKAEELARKHDWFLTRQFENEANADAHSKTTAREILDDFDGRPLDYWVSGYGTGGTLKGVARVLREERPDIRIIGCEPENSALLTSGVTQPKNAEGVRTSHPIARPHPVQGWGPDFIPKLVEDAVADGWIDEILPVNGAKSLQLARDAASREGIFCGISGGATLAAALEVCNKAPQGSTVLCMLPDTGERYMSTVLFDDVSSEMTVEEHAIAASTPLCRFDAPPPAVPSPNPEADEAPPEVDVEARDFVEAAISDKTQPVVMFSLEWCEFCWSVRKMFAATGIPYQSVHLDSVAYQKDNLGGKIRADLKARTGCVTIPQIFVGGQFIGGCTEVFDAYRDGSLQSALGSTGITLPEDNSVDPYDFLPKWLHARGAA